MTSHHPDDALLLGLAAGRLATGPALVVGVHAEQCAHCQGRLLDFTALGGCLLESVAPVLLDAGALDRTLARAAEPLQRPDVPEPADEFAGLLASLPAGMRWPDAMRGSTASKWRWNGKGRRWSRVTLRGDPTANVVLLRIEPGRVLPVHSHHGGELTQVLHGAFRDGSERFDAGDFEEANGEVHHQPVAEPGEPCICLATVDGRLAFEGPMARLWGALVGL